MGPLVSGHDVRDFILMLAFKILFSLSCGFEVGTAFLHLFLASRFLLWSHKNVKLDPQFLASFFLIDLLCVRSLYHRKWREKEGRDFWLQKPRLLTRTKIRIRKGLFRGHPVPESSSCGSYP
ncbi:uncharacterized protein LOC129296602 [Prosopis cineraria]|uniref:uncharacterized protein LOC129296602 n=1 Tax=Prosopis cineraria TaxID=364024 RepID=UPI00240EE3CF|nr:uncharacterized protein LOC129296602 [Prosopis cineraria]